jgi:hypothetical protein
MTDAAFLSVVCAPVQWATGGGILQTQSDALATRRADLTTYVNARGGSLIVLTQAGLTNPYSFFPVPLVYTFEEFSDVTITGNMAQVSSVSDSANLDHDLWHGYFTGPTNYAGIFQVLVRENHPSVPTIIIA